MSSRDPKNWMLSEAIEQLSRAERMHREFFRLSTATETRMSSWEPPIDVIETDDEVLIIVALPGVDPEAVQAIVSDGILVISGERTLPQELRHARIHRLELPQGRFERRIALPAGRYSISRFPTNGCIVLRLAKCA